MARLDPHSYADDAHPRVERFDWTATVDFTRRTLDASVELSLAETQGGPLDLDTRGLTIHGVTARGQGVPFSMSPPHPILGARLRLMVPPGAERVCITYTTSPDATALQWLDPAQTLGGTQPFLFSQCQAIHARSVVPLQDSPRFRVPYGATMRVPSALRAVMAAGFVSRREEGDWATERYQMPQPIPPYLFAFAVGQLEHRELSPRCRVWAEPALVDRAAAEFSQVEAMMAAAEALYGPYDWDRFDLLTMPPSFPYGGMENPRLTFLTPALVVGDRSLVDVVAHELAHSWTGNLVTNADAEHFWLNEGFTVYAERRISEALEGVEAARLAAALGRRELDEAVARFSARPYLTALNPTLADVDPDEAFSVVPYEKGFLFLTLLERELGRPRFDALLKRWLATHRFQAVTTEQLAAFFDQEAPGLWARVDAQQWLKGPGVPANAPRFESERLSQVEATGLSGPSAALAAKWTPTEWVLWLDRLPALTSAQAEALDRAFGLNGSKNPEVLVGWLKVALKAGYAPALPRVEYVVSSFGRMKYLRPLYAALLAAPGLRAEAERLFERYQGRYHPIARQVVGGLLARAAQ